MGKATVPPTNPAKDKLVKNERIKITAMLLNNASLAACITSVIGPVAADLYGVAIPPSPN